MSDERAAEKAIVCQSVADDVIWGWAVRLLNTILNI